MKIYFIEKCVLDTCMIKLHKLQYSKDMKHGWIIMIYFNWLKIVIKY